jgi:hypothetical protein
VHRPSLHSRPHPQPHPSGSIYLVNGAFISSHLLFDISYYGVTVDMKSNICVAQCLEGRDFDNGNDGGTINGKYCESAFTSHTGNEVLCQLFDAPLYETDWVIVGSGSNQTVDLGIGENRSCA